jgi:hypothetical protein
MPCKPMTWQLVTAENVGLEACFILAPCREARYIVGSFFMRPHPVQPAASLQLPSWVELRLGACLGTWRSEEPLDD